MKVEVLPDFDAVGAERWNTLLDRSRTASVFLTWQWQAGWTRAFAPDASLELLAACDDAGQLVERELPGSRVRSESDAGWGTALSRFLGLHRLSKVGKARFMDDRMEGFFRAVTADLARAGWARLWFLEGPDGPVARFLCVEYAGAVGLYNSGFDPAHARLAPGIVLLAHVIRDAIDRGIAVFDFLRGEEAYKYTFGPAATDLYAVRLEG